MNNPTRETDEAGGAQVYSDSNASGDAPAGAPGTSNVRVYDRPEGTQASGMMGTILLIIALLVIAALVWYFVF